MEPLYSGTEIIGLIIVVVTLITYANSMWQVATIQRLGIARFHCMPYKLMKIIIILYVVLCQPLPLWEVLCRTNALSLIKHSCYSSCHTYPHTHSNSTGSKVSSTQQTNYNTTNSTHHNCLYKIMSMTFPHS